MRRSHTQIDYCGGGVELTGAGALNNKDELRLLLVGWRAAAALLVRIRKYYVTRTRHPLHTI